MRLLIEAGNIAIGVEDGRIVDPSGAFDRVIALRDCELRPGLINAHDHLHRNHYGRLGNPPYDNAYEWAADIQTNYAEAIARRRTIPRREALLRGAWKNLLSGVTHVLHHDAWESEFERDFPVKIVRIANADSLSMTPQLTGQHNGPFSLHVAEGIDRIAADEIRELDKRGLLTRDLIAVHAVGADLDGIARLRASGCAIVWCPTSNHFLFGCTAPEALLDEGVDVLIGSDSLLTGAGTLLDELRAARGIISDQGLRDAVGTIAAKRFDLAEPKLAPGAPADLVVFRKPLLEAELNDVALVMVDGNLRVLDPELVPTAGAHGGQIFEWRGVRRWISEEMLP
jgi:cytosine/adenosine deaminase-related metal-dependent hydrolase